MSRIITLLFLVFVFFIPFVITKKKKKKYPKGSVQKKGLVSVSVTSDAIFNHHNVTVETKKFRNYKKTVLAFLTPWNSKGFEITEKLPHKFDMLSPVWFQIQRSQETGNFQIFGDHDVRLEWVKSMKKKNKDISICPRYRVELKSQEDFMEFFQNERKYSKMILDSINKYDFDGLVFEWGFLKYVDSYMTPFIQTLRRYIGTKYLTVALPPIKLQSEHALFTKTDFDSIQKDIDFALVMTYDYDGGTPSLAPIPWIKKSMKAISTRKSKLLMGIQFYGYKQNIVSGQMEPILGHEYLELLQQFHDNNNNEEISWDKDMKEHFFQVGDVVVRYPSLEFINTRLEVSKKIANGISIWEIGQGLDYFCDLL